MRDYTEHLALADFVLEESFVLDVAAVPGKLTLQIDFVLTPSHPRFRVPKRGETMCFALGQICFGRVVELTWAGQSARPAIGADGVHDYGHIDALLWSGTGYRLSGEFGEITVVAASMDVRLDD